jgi:hypothetical protein
MSNTYLANSIAVLQVKEKPKQKTTLAQSTYKPGFLAVFAKLSLNRVLLHLSWTGELRQRK